MICENARINGFDKPLGLSASELQHLRQLTKRCNNQQLETLSIIVHQEKERRK